MTTIIRRSNNPPIVKKPTSQRTNITTASRINKSSFLMKYPHYALMGTKIYLNVCEWEATATIRIILFCFYFNITGFLGNRANKIINVTSNILIAELLKARVF
jgi:hypothetical protein